MKLEIHPVALAKLGLLSRQQARRLLMLGGWFNALETEELLIEAGCIDSHECWTPYRTLSSSPWLIYEETEQ
jgi:hypothetical protein